MRGKILGAAALLTFGSLFLDGSHSTAKAQDILGAPFIENVKPYLEFRPRYEYVDVDGSSKDAANALTIRTKIGVKIGKVLGVDGLFAQLEGIDVSAVVDDFYPEKTGYETVLDPHNDRMTQAFIGYKYGNYVFIAGRKYVTIDDHRFIGNVNWRQMPQSLGVVAIAGSPIENLNFLLAGVYERKGIVDGLNVDWHMDKMPIVLDINYKLIPELKLKGFAYLLTDIHNTYGIKASGSINISGIKFSYLGEYAKQTDPYEKDNLNTKPDIDTDYYRVKLGAAYSGFFGNVMYTYFGDADGKDAGFSTPLATLHKFDGWSDVLLKGAAKGFKYGLKELCVSAGYKSKSIGKFMVAYLTFDADKDQVELGNSTDIGSEVDVLYAKKLTKRLSFLAKAAFYSADDGYVFTGNKIAGTKDVTKYWLQLNYKY